MGKNMIELKDNGDITATRDCSLSKKEAFAVAEFIDCNLFDYIRNDTDVDSIGWLRNVLRAYEKMCKASGFVGLTENVEEEE